MFPSHESPVFATFDEHLDAVSFHAPARGTGALSWDAATSKWLIVHYYLSFPIPNDLAKDMCKKIGIFERQAAISAHIAVSDWDDTVVKNTGSGSVDTRKPSTSKKKNKKK